MSMEHFEKRDGYVYLVTGDKGFETFYNMGKDPDDPMWSDELKPKKRKKKKSED